MQKSSFKHRRAFVIPHENIEHPKKEMNAIPGSGSDYCFLFKPGETGVHSRKFLCVSCPGCMEGKWLNSTGVMRGK